MNSGGILSWFIGGTLGGGVDTHYLGLLQEGIVATVWHSELTLHLAHLKVSGALRGVLVEGRARCKPSQRPLHLFLSSLLTVKCVL